MRRTVAFFGACLVLTLSACGGGSSDDGARSTPERDDSFPVTIEAANGPVRIEAEPERIVSLSPTATEMLFAIDAG
ncbi:MAG: ABC transporter substrate-binding protein, partial [Actinomycetota bacterium]|nr:ABC transporter substrate-binding protein [Actinomycetota bacterium]